MVANAQLSVTIPTYNRADLLDTSLQIHVPILKKYGVSLFISDNASTDHTRRVVEKWQEAYPLIYYHCNQTNVGPDANFEIALRLPKTEYIWLLGDSYILPENGLSYVLKTISACSELDLLVLNLRSSITIPTQYYDNQNKLLRELSGLMSCISCLVYSRQLITTTNFSRYYNTNFIQTGIIFEYLASKKPLVHWVQDCSVELLEPMETDKKSWRDTDQALDIGVERWVNFIFSLPPVYSLNAKLIGAKSFGVASNLLKIQGLLSMRAEGALTINKLFRHQQAFILSTSLYKFILSLLICFIPVSILSKIKRIVKNRAKYEVN